MFMQDAKTFRAAEEIALSFSGLTAAPGSGGGGILASSLVETAQGWRRAGSLARGSLVQTWDGGLCQLTRVARRSYWRVAGAEMVHVPGGAIGNCSDLWLMPDQNVMIASRVAEEVLDASAALVPARALAGFLGASLCPLDRPVEMVALGFARDEVAYVNSGALILCAGDGSAEPEADYFPRLDDEEARAMLALIAEGALNTRDLPGRAA